MTSRKDEFENWESDQDVRGVPIGVPRTLIHREKRSFVFFIGIASTGPQAFHVRTNWHSMYANLAFRGQFIGIPRTA